jgi:putative phage-type endonuclease
VSSLLLIQGSDEWLRARLGKVTASRIADVVARTKTGWGASRANYAAQLIAERLTGALVETYTNAAMQWGTATEAEARLAYADSVIETVTEVGFIPHPRIAMTGASPDGLVGDAGLVELKCPNTATHIEILLGGKVPDKYILQMQWQMACAERAYCDFVSYDPRLPAEMRLFVKRLDRDDKRIAELSKEVMIFLDEVMEKVESLQAKFTPIARAA